MGWFPLGFVEDKLMNFDAKVHTTVDVTTYMYAPIKVMPHLPPTWHRRGLDHFCVLIPCPLGIFGGLIPGVLLDFVQLS